MAETAVESKICDICGAEVRDGSLFCYNCGGSVGGTAKVGVQPGADPSNGGTTASPKTPVRDRGSARRQRAANRQPKQIVWEARTGVSTSFIVGSLVFLLIALLLFIGALYLR